MLPLRICDYKTGAPPQLKYSETVNQRIHNESFEQLLIYALLLHRQPPPELMVPGVNVRYLRLFYLQSRSSNDKNDDDENETAAAEWRDYDLGENLDQRADELHNVHVRLARVWHEIQELCARGDALVWQPCERDFCFCHKCRPRFEPGTVAQPVEINHRDEEIEVDDEILVEDASDDRNNGKEVLAGNANSKSMTNSQSVLEAKSTNSTPDSSTNATDTATTLDTTAKVLVSSLHEDSGWLRALEPTFSTPHFQKLAHFVASEASKYTVFPKADCIWAALNHCPLDKVNVVILGQDPYHGFGQAHGLCFSVLPNHEPLPRSLMNIFNELESDDKVDFDRSSYSNGHLLPWAQQGVLMLNTVLTVRQGQPNSHKNKGWEEVTHSILSSLHGRNCVFLVWGKPALERVQALQDQFATRMDNNSAGDYKHVVIASSHPSPFSANKTAAPFLSSRCFSRCNDALIDMGMAPIDWKLQK